MSGLAPRWMRSVIAWWPRLIQGLQQGWEAATVTRRNGHSNRLSHSCDDASQDYMIMEGLGAAVLGRMEERGLTELISVIYLPRSGYG